MLYLRVRPLKSDSRVWISYPLTSSLNQVWPTSLFCAALGYLIVAISDSWMWHWMTGFPCEPKHRCRLQLAIQVHPENTCPRWSALFRLLVLGVHNLLEISRRTYILVLETFLGRFVTRKTCRFTKFVHLLIYIYMYTPELLVDRAPRSSRTY